MTTNSLNFSADSPLFQAVSFHSVSGVGGRIHPVLGRTAAPVAGTPGLLVPNVGPVAVARFANHLDLDACFLGGSRDQLRRIDGAGKAASETDSWIAPEWPDFL
jgi:hypothetical protein